MLWWLRWKLNKKKRKENRFELFECLDYVPICALTCVCPLFPVHSFQLSPILRELAHFAFNAVKYNVEYVTYSSDLSVYRFNLKVVLNLLKGTKMSEEQQQQIVERYMAEAEEMKERYNDAQRHSRAVLAAKLAARRRQKEEINKEAAMKKELKEMSKKQVIRVMFQTFL